MALSTTGHALANPQPHHHHQPNPQRGNSMDLAKDFVRHLVHSKSERVSLVLSDTMRSAVWTCFYKIFVDGYQTSFVVCRNCGHILKYTPKDGTTAMRIHMGKFCGRMKAKAIQGTPQTPLVPTATASGQNGPLTRLTPTPKGSNNLDEPLDLQKPQLKPILASNNSNNNSNPLSQLSGAMDSPLTAAASAIAAAAAAITGNNGAAASFPSSLNSTSSSGTRPSLHAPLPIRQMTPTAKAQEILSAFNPIPPSALPTPKTYLAGSQAPPHNISSSSNTPTSPSQGAHPPLFGASRDAPCDLVVRKSTSCDASQPTCDGLEAVAVAFKAALSTFEDDLRELDSKISETEAELDKLRSKRLNLISSRDHVNNAARVVLSSVNEVSPDTTYEPHPVEAMIDWVRRNSNTTSVEAGLKRAVQTTATGSPLSNWPQDLQMQFGRGPKRLRKAYTAVRRSVASNGSSTAGNTNSNSNPTALGNASELLNGVLPLTTDSKPANVSMMTGENNVLPSAIGNSDGSSVANTPPSSEYLHQDHDDDDDHYMSVPLVKGEHMDDVDIEDESGDEANSSANASLTAEKHSMSAAPRSMRFESRVSLLDGSDSTLTVTCATVTGAFVFAGLSDGTVLRYDTRNCDGELNPVSYTPFAGSCDASSISCIEPWIFGDNDDDFAILLGTERGIFRVYNPDFSNLLCEKKLNWAVTALRVVPKRHMAYIGLKMGVLVSVDLDKMELAAKVVCGFGAIVDVDWVDNDFLLVATEDGTVSVRDFGGQVISSIDMTSASPLSRIRAVATENEIYVVAASQKRGLLAASLRLNGESSDKPLLELSNGQAVAHFGQLCPNFMFSIDNSGAKLTVHRFGSDEHDASVITQEVLDDDEQATSAGLVHSSVYNGGTFFFVCGNGLLKIFRVLTN